MGKSATLTLCLNSQTAKDMGQPKSTIAIVGDPQEVAEMQAEQLLPHLRQMLTIEPPMDVKEAAAWLGVAESHLYKLVARGAIPFQNVGLPGVGKIQARFYKHKLAEWGGG